MLKWLFGLFEKESANYNDNNLDELCQLGIKYKNGDGIEYNAPML